MATKTRRYAEHATVRSGQEFATDDSPPEDDGQLDVELADLALGQRLTAISGAPENSGGSDSSVTTNHEPLHSLSAPSKQPNSIPSTSLTRTLIQALHSSDVGLLELCLRHSDQRLIRSTVQKLPPQLVTPLLIACVERLGRGARGVDGKGSGGGASAQRGMTLVVWIKTALSVHSGHLMTVPDLVARLASLHSTLSSRLALHECLLSLNGRLSLAVSQIEMRSSGGPTLVTPRRRKQKGTDSAKPTTVQYVEGESTDDEIGDMELTIETNGNEEEGSVEEIEFGDDEDFDSGDEEDEDDDEDEESSEGDDGDGAPLHEYIDDEAQEFSDEDDP